MRLVPFSAQHLALADTGPVLLVGDDEGQLVVDHLLLYERMGSDNDIGFVGGDFPVGGPLLLCRHGTGYQHHLFVNAIFLEQGEHGLVVLSGKNLCRHHERALISVVSRLQQGEDGDNGLSGADITLN